MKALLTNIGLFKIGWLACVLGAAYAMPWLGLVAVPLIVALHLSQAEMPNKELTLIITAGLIGLVWESLLVAAGWLEYVSGMWVPNMAPLWIVAMWLLFATTINVSLRFLKGRWLMAAVAGAIAGPMAFFAGSRLGAVIFPDVAGAMFILAVGWGLLLPALVIFSEHLDDRFTLAPGRG